MSKITTALRALVSARLITAAEEIFTLFESTLAEYEEEMCRSRVQRVRSAGVQTEAVCESPNLPSKVQTVFSYTRTDPTETREIYQTGMQGCEFEAQEATQETPERLHSDSAMKNNCSAHEMESDAEEIHEQRQPNEDGVDKDSPTSSVLSKPKMRKKRGRMSSLKRMRQECSVCHKILKGPSSNLMRHMIIHTGQRPYSCSVCQRSFTQQCVYRRHMETHQEPEEHQKSAKETQTRASDVQKTEAETESPDTFSCSVCGQRFRRYVTLKKHLQRHEALTMRKQTKDVIVEKSLEAKDQQQQEEKEQEGSSVENGADYTRATLMKTMHTPSVTTSGLDHCCSVCHRAFTTRTRLKRHMIVHTGDKPFSCPVCNKCFSQKYNVRLHMAVHTDEKPFSCQLCYKSYRRNDDLRTHMTTHTGQVLFSCVVCNAVFKQRNCLTSHMRLHTGVRPYRCPMCTKTFIQKSNLNRHVRSHTGEKPFRCPVCPQRFVQRSDIRKHMAIHA